MKPLAVGETVAWPERALQQAESSADTSAAAPAPAPAAASGALRYGTVLELQSSESAAVLPRVRVLMAPGASRWLLTTDCFVFRSMRSAVRQSSPGSRPAAAQSVGSAAAAAGFGAEAAADDRAACSAENNSDHGAATGSAVRRRNRYAGLSGVATCIFEAIGCQQRAVTNLCDTR